MSTVIPLGPVLSAAPGRRRAGVAVIAGVGVGVTLIWGSLSALNRFVLGFHAWPQAPQVAAQRLVIPDAPARVSDRQRLAAIRLLGTAGGAVGGLRLVPGAGGLVVVSGGPASPGQGVGGITGSGPRFRPGTGGQSAPGVSGGVQSPSAGAVSKTDPDGDGIPTSVEQQLGTNPTSADSDGDGTSDGAEQSVGANPLNASDGGQPPVSGIGSPVAFGPAPSEGDSGAKDPSGGVGDPSPATGGTGAVTPLSIHRPTAARSPIWRRRRPIRPRPLRRPRRRRRLTRRPRRNLRRTSTRRRRPRRRPIRNLSRLRRRPSLRPAASQLRPTRRFP